MTLPSLNKATLQNPAFLTAKPFPLSNEKIGHQFPVSHKIIEIIEIIEIIGNNSQKKKREKNERKKPNKIIVNNSEIIVK